MEATKGTPPYTWSLASGIYPDGIVLEPNGLFHGKPTKVKNCYFGVKVEDASKPKSQDYLWCELHIGESGCECGDTNKDGNIDSSDISFLINYYFYDGPMPTPVSNNDFNCDGKIGLDDIVILNRHIFGNGTLNCCLRVYEGSYNKDNISEANSVTE